MQAVSLCSVNDLTRRKENSPEDEGDKTLFSVFSVLSAFSAFSALSAFLVLSRTFEPRSLSEELKWRHNISGDHTGPGHPIAGGEEHLHLQGGPREQQHGLLSDHKTV